MAVVFLIVVFTASHVSFVNADIAYYYSPLCLGGWKNPKNIQGQPQVPFGSDDSLYDDNNSSVLENVSGQVYCGNFVSDQSPDSLNTLTLRISMAVKEPQQITPGDFNSGSTLDSSVDATGNFIIAAPVDSQTASGSDENTPTPTPTPEPTDAPAPTDSPASSSSGFNFFPAARADDSLAYSDNLDNILQVQYTSDGSTWNTLGYISNSNWQDASFQLPTMTGQDIANLQISVLSLPTMPQNTKIYIDSMWLEGQYDSGLTQFAKNVGQEILDALTLKPITDIQSPNPTPEVSSSDTPSPTPTPIPKIKKIIYEFSAQGVASAPDQVLSWYPSSFVDKLKTLGSGGNAQVSADGEKLKVSGSCTGDYYSVMIFPNRDDYTNAPGSAVYNAAFPCQGVLIDKTISEFPSLVNSGDYYVLIGQQSGRDPWRPISQIYPIHLEQKEIEVDATSQ